LHSFLVKPFPKSAECGISFVEFGGNTSEESQIEADFSIEQEQSSFSSPSEISQLAEQHDFSHEVGAEYREQLPLHGMTTCTA